MTKNYIMSELERFQLECAQDERIDEGKDVFVSACSADKYFLDDDGTIYLKDGSGNLGLCAFTSKEGYEECKRWLEGRKYT